MTWLKGVSKVSCGSRMARPEFTKAGVLSMPTARSNASSSTTWSLQSP